MNACYKGLRAGEKCGQHPEGCPITVMTPEARADAFIAMNHPMLASYSAGLFRQRLIETLRSAEESARTATRLTKA